MSLSIIPWDILFLIIKHADDPSTLACLAACNKQLHELVTPILYSHVRLGFERVNRDPNGISSSSHQVGASLYFR